MNAPIGHESITVRATPIVGNVDLYMLRCPLSSAYRCAAQSLPNATHYTLTTFGDFSKHSLTMQRNDDTPSVYIVGVNALSYYSAYQISASFVNSVLALQAGVAVMDHVDEGEVDYFSFYFDDNSFESLHIVLTTVSQSRRARSGIICEKF